MESNGTNKKHTVGHLVTEHARYSVRLEWLEQQNQSESSLLEFYDVAKLHRGWNILLFLNGRLCEMIYMQRGAYWELESTN